MYSAQHFLVRTPFRACPRRPMQQVWTGVGTAHYVWLACTVLQNIPEITGSAWSFHNEKPLTQS